MIKAKRINSKIVCFINGKIYEKDFQDESKILEVYEQLMNVDENNTDEVNEVIQIFTPEPTREEIEILEKIAIKEEQAEEQAELLHWIDTIRREGHELFEVKGLKFYVKGINITVPETIIQRFLKRRDSEEDTKALLNFWRLCSLNSDPRCREDLYKFLEKSGMTVTPSGYIVAYRNVHVKREGNREFNEFIISQYTKIKRKWKKKPSNYYVVKVLNTEDPDIASYTIEKIANWNPELNHEVIGTLDKVYEELNQIDSDTTIYTDAHTKTFEIVMGQVVSMPRNKCDANPDNTCSRGLHLGNEHFMRNNKNYFGSVGIMCLLNPKDIVAVPASYEGKLRCCSYLPIGISEYDEDNNLIPVDTTTFECEYAEFTQDELEDMVKSNTSLEELKEHEILPLELDIQSLRDILNKTTTSLQEMNQVIQNKVKKV